MFGYSKSLANFANDMKILFLFVTEVLYGIGNDIAHGDV